MSELITAVKDALLKRQEVEKLTGLGRSAIYNRLDPKNPHFDPSFPRPVAVGTSSVRWVSTEVSAWIEARIAERDARRGNAQGIQHQHLARQVGTLDGSGQPGPTLGVPQAEAAGQVHTETFGNPVRAGISPDTRRTAVRGSSGRRAA